MTSQYWDICIQQASMKLIRWNTTRSMSTKILKPTHTFWIFSCARSLHNKFICLYVKALICKLSKDAMRNSINSVLQVTVFGYQAVVCWHIRALWRIHASVNFTIFVQHQAITWINAGLLYPPKRSLGGVYWIHPVRPSVCPSVRPSVRPSVGRCPDDNSNSFQWI